MRLFVLTSFLFIALLPLSGQNQIDLDLEWLIREGKEFLLQNEGYDSGNLPVVFRRIPIGEGDSISVSLKIADEEDVSGYRIPDGLSSTYQIRTYTEVEKGQKYGTIFLYPIKSSGSRITILKKGSLIIDRIPHPLPRNTRSVSFKSESVLADGKILKLPVVESTIYKITRDQLPASWTETGFDPDLLQLFTGHGPPLPYGAGDEKTDDLEEVAFHMENQLSNASDGIYFYGQGRNIKKSDHEPGFLTTEHNIYSDTNYYFLRYGVAGGKKMTVPEPMADRPPSAIQTGSDVYLYREANYNILESILQGSGRVWYTDAFTGPSRRDYSSLISSLDIDPEQEVLFSAGFAGRSDHSNTITFQLGEKEFSSSILSVTMTERYGIAARHVDFKEKTSLTNPNLSLHHETRQSSSRGWLEYIQLAYSKSLKYGGSPYYFSLFSDEPYVQINDARENLLVMDITDPLNTDFLPVFNENNQLWFRRKAPSSDQMNAYFVFEPSQAVPIRNAQTVDNQNLHEMRSVDYLIIYHPRFTRSVETLANHRKNYNNFKVETVNVHHIYNEYSSGKVDPSAIRNFIKMLYDRGNRDIRVLLFGDGSYVYKYDPKKFDFPDENLIPVYETENSLNPIRAFPSDDYYALLDDHEGGDLKGALDISIGRIPVRSTSEADIMVQKIIAYETHPQRFGDWRKNVLMVSDDGNHNLFVNYNERLSNNIETKEPRFQIGKAYIDGFPKQTAPNGFFSPRINELINNGAYQGQIMMNYQGHGSSKGWADEAILTKMDLEKWNNPNKYPILVTATCTFAGYDDPKEITAGEYSLILPDKGAISLFTTTRVVYANSNDRLTNSLFDRLMERMDAPPEQGEWMRLAKNAHRSDTLDINSRKFALLGDPAMTIGIPKYQILVEDINGQNPSTDSIRLGALEKVKIKGRVTDYNNQTQTQFNGTLYPTLYDKKKTLYTLGQGRDNSETPYSIWQNILYKGRASVTNGEFEFEFIIPKDINYAVGPGRLILYGDDGIQSDAWGLGEQILIGGTASDPIPDDQTGPDVKIYLGDKNFENGDEVSSNTILLVDIEDESGINVSGNGIGHDLIYYLDGDASASTVLNNYFTYDLNSYTRGSVEFPLDNLETGKHTLTIKVWDSYNNFSEKTVEFYVNKKDLTLERVLNYPNPFFDQTEFQFENPMIGEDISIVIDIFTPSGRMVHRILEQRNSSSSLVRGIQWNGRDQWHQKLANGVYIYKIKIIQESGTKKTEISSDFQKLLLLN